MKRSIFCATILTTVLLSFNFSNAAMVEKTEYVAPLSSSINLKKIVENYGTSINKMDMVEVDLNDKNNFIDVLINPQGIYKTMSIKKVASETPDIVAAANADFFFMQNPSSAIGPMVKNHRVIASPAETDGKYASMIVTDDNKVSFEYVKPGVIVKNLTKGKNTVIYTFNKILSSAYSGYTIRSSEFSYYTFGKDKKNPKRVEVIVGSDKKVKEIREGQEAVKIPYGGCAIMSVNTDGSDLKNKFAVGDEIDLRLNVNDNRDDVRTVIGGGTLLVKDFKKTNLTEKIAGKAQRTTAAVTKDNKLLIMTNDGRQLNSPGFTEQDLQNYMMILKVKEAMIFDGGGSTELYADKKVQNTLFGERKVINAIAVKNNNSKEIDKINITPLSDLIYTGDNVEIVVSAQDKNGNKITDLNTPDFKIITEGFSSKILERTIVPTSAGKGKIAASANGVTASVDVEVLDRHAVDMKNSIGKDEDKKFNIYPDMSDQNGIVLKFLKSKIMKNSKDSDVNIIFTNKDKYFSDNLKGKKYNLDMYYYKNAINDTDLLTVNNTISLGSSDVQLNGLRSAINSSNNKNLIIMLPDGEKMRSSYDQHYFDKLLESKAKEKNIFVIYKSTTNSGYKKGNVSYISIADFKNQDMKDLKNMKYLQMCTDQNKDIIYNFKQVIDK